MPAVIPAHVAIRTRLKDTIHHSLQLSDQLKAATAIKSRMPSGVFHGKIDFSQPPWNASAANTYLDLHALSREMEEWLRISQQLPLKRRGGSDTNTRKALEGVSRLSEKADDHIVKRHTRSLDAWCRRAGIALGEIETPRRIPRMPGQPEPACPFCRHHTLRAFPLYGLIKCIDPGCKDDQDRKPSARLEYSEHVGDFIILWQDGIPGVPA